MKKKCKEGHYYCYKDSKCKPIPKGYRIGLGGYLRREREDEKEDSKKNGNGNGNGNNGSNGSNGNGSGNGNGVSGGNGGGNGSGGVGESVEIQNSDGETTAVVVDIIGPAHMRPRLNGDGVWKGTHITEMGNRIRKGGYTILGSGNKKDSSKGPNEQTPVDYRGVGEGLPTAKIKTKTIAASHEPDGDLTEYAAALPQLTNIAVKAAPYIMTGIGALGSVLQMARPRKDGSTNDRKNLRPDLEAELRQRQKEREEKIKATTPNLDDKLNTPTDQGGFAGGS